jgi:GT2 family glycosyltransferase
MRPANDPSRLAAEIRRRLGPPPELSPWPLVSIVVLNRDGAGLLRRLLAGLVECTDYPDLELILVDNASADDSVEFVRNVAAPFPISILANRHNESFADGCNQGAELASGELLLFLNNDAEPFEPGWLRELVACLRESGAGAVGPTLLEPVEDGAGPAGSHRVHQRGLVAREEGGMFVTGYRDRGADPLGEGLGSDVETIALAAAALLLERRTFEQVAGFSHGYWYGPEDVDLALKLRERGRPSLCSGRSLLIHPPNSTLDAIEREQRGEWVRGNRRLFAERWAPRARRECRLDRLRGGGLWIDPVPAGAAPPQFSEAEVEALGFCFKAAEAEAGAAAAATAGVEVGAAAEGPGPAGEPPLAALCAAFRRRGHRCLVLRGAEVEDPAALDHDVAVHLRGPLRHVPKPAQLNVLWSVSHGDDLSAIECSRYDLVLTDSEDLARRLCEEGPTAPLAILAAADLRQPDRLAAALLAAVEARAREIGLRTRIDHGPPPASNRPAA